MLSEQSKVIFKAFADYEGDCEFEIERKSKWVLVIRLVNGLCLIAKFKINCRTGKFERLI